MKRLFCLLILLVFLTASCQSVYTPHQRKDAKDTESTCGVKTGKNRFDCYNKRAKNHLANKEFKSAAKIYQQLGDETGEKNYYTKAADAFNRINKPDLALPLYMKAKNYVKAKETLRDYLHKNRKNDSHKKLKFIRHYCEKLGLSEEYERLAEIAVKQKKFSIAATYRKKIKEKKRIQKNWEHEGFRHLAKKHYRKAADCFLKANKPILSKDAFISGAENALKKKKPKYKYAIKNYQMAGLEKRGKKTCCNGLDKPP